MKRAVSIKQVAEEAGVSITTVSHVLSDKGRLSEQTRARVRLVAERLGYRPNAAARNLAGGKTGILGIAVSAIHGLPFAVSDFEYFVQLMTAASATALERGYALVLTPRSGDARDPLARVQLDGAIIVDPVHRDPLVASLRARAIPIVTTGRIVSENDDGYWVDNDHVAGTRAMLDHLARRGAERIAIIASPPEASYAADALRAYQVWCEGHGCNPLIAIVGKNRTERGGYDAAVSLLDRPEPPDAIYATLDRLALGAMLAAHARTIAVPDTLLLAGCTDSAAGKMARPSLTALALNPNAIGRRAVEILTALVEGHAPSDPHVLVPTRVLPRGSTKRRSA